MAMCVVVVDCAAQLNPQAKKATPRQLKNQKNQGYHFIIYGRVEEEAVISDKSGFRSQSLDHQALMISPCLGNGTRMLRRYDMNVPFLLTRLLAQH